MHLTTLLCHVELSNALLRCSHMESWLILKQTCQCLAWIWNQPLGGNCRPRQPISKQPHCLWCWKKTSSLEWQVDCALAVTGCKDFLRRTGSNEQVSRSTNYTTGYHHGSASQWKHTRLVGPEEGGDINIHLNCSYSRRLCSEKRGWTFHFITEGTGGSVWGRENSELYCGSLS